MANIFDRKAEYDVQRPYISKATYDRKYREVVGLLGLGKIVGSKFRLSVSGSFVPLRDGKPISETRGSADADELIRPKSEYYIRRDRNGKHFLMDPSVPEEYFQELRLHGGNLKRTELKFDRRGMTDVADVWLECPANEQLLRAAWPRVHGPLSKRLQSIAKSLWKQEWMADVRLLNTVSRQAGISEIQPPVADFEGWNLFCDMKIAGHNNSEFITKLRRELPIAKALALAKECGNFAGLVTGIAVMGHTGESCIPHPPSTRGPQLATPEGWAAVYSEDFGTLLVPPDGFLVLREHMSSAGSYLRERLADFFKANIKNGQAVYIWPSGNKLVEEAILFGWVRGGFSHLVTSGIEQLYPGANEALSHLPKRQELMSGWPEAYSWAREVVARAVEEVAPTITLPFLNHIADGDGELHRRVRHLVKP